MSFAQGESTLRGKAPDHAALYGLLARPARFLAIPLVAVRVLDAEAQHKLAQTSRRYDLLINGLLVALYLVLLGGSGHDHRLCRACDQRGVGPHAAVRAVGRGGPRLLALERPTGLALGQLRSLARRRHHLSNLHPAFRPDASALGIAIMLLLLASGLLYAMDFLRRHADDLKSGLAGGGYRGGGPRNVLWGRAPDDDRATETTE